MEVLKTACENKNTKKASVPYYVHPSARRMDFYIKGITRIYNVHSRGLSEIAVNPSHAKTIRGYYTADFI